MTRLEIADGRLVVHFPGWERWAVGRDRFAVALTDIQGVTLTHQWISEMWGLRSGVVVSGFRKMGVWTRPNGERRLASMRRGVPILRILLAAGQEFTEVVVSDPEAPAVARALQTEISR